LDPPRSGATRESIETIIESGIKQIVYVSCSPMTLARDLRLLLGSGKYELQSLQSFDMFPNTWHIECLAVLNRI
jgi:23S rRNA (uracil1939-C5)-methyltransferase